MKNKIKTLVLSGASILGFSELGALKAIDENGILATVEEYIGTSSGALLSGLLAVGYTVDELIELNNEIDVLCLIRDSKCLLSNIIEKYGVYNGTKFENTIEKYIYKKTGIKNCTFSQVDKNLTIISTNLNLQKADLLNRANTPNLPISKAIRMSSSYPFILTPVKYNGFYYSDGGLSMNYPIIIVENLDESLGISIYKTYENLDGTLTNPQEINSYLTFLGSIIFSLDRSLYMCQISEKYLDRSILIKVTESTNIDQMKLTLTQKRNLYKNGYDSTIANLGRFISNETGEAGESDNLVCKNHCEVNIINPIERKSKWEKVLIALGKIFKRNA